jgi:hypothetical protein
VYTLPLDHPQSWSAIIPRSLSPFADLPTFVVWTSEGLLTFGGFEAPYGAWRLEEAQRSCR